MNLAFFNEIKTLKCYVKVNYGNKRIRPSRKGKNQSRSG